MRKKVFGRHFSRSRKAREALFKSLIKAFVLHGKMTTTLAKARAIQGEIDKLVKVAKSQGISASRQISASLSADRKLVEKFIKDVSSFGQRTSGFTKIIRLPARFGDAAEMARIEWVDQVEILKKEVSKTSKSKKENKAKKAPKSLKREKKDGAKSVSRKNK